MRVRSPVAAPAQQGWPKQKSSSLHLPDDDDVYFDASDGDAELAPFLVTETAALDGPPTLESPTMSPRQESYGFKNDSSPFLRRLPSQGSPRQSCYPMRSRRRPHEAEAPAQFWLSQLKPSSTRRVWTPRQRFVAWCGALIVATVTLYSTAIVVDVMTLGERGSSSGDLCAAVPRTIHWRRDPLRLFEKKNASSLRQSDLRYWGSHNSYHRAPSWRRFPWLGAVVPSWAYTHVALGKQLDLGARHLELDVHVDSVSRRLTVYHVPSLDPRTRCYCLASCARELLEWSRKLQGRHSLIFVLLEPKGARSWVEDPRSHDRGFGTNLDETTAVLDLIDDAIFSAFKQAPDKLFTPRDLLAGNGTSLADAVSRRGWPPHDALLGKFAFALLDSTPHSLLTRVYSQGGATNRRRHQKAMFAMANEWIPPSQGRRLDDDPLDVAIYKLDNPKRIGLVDDIQAAVRQGFIVRTRANTMRRPYDNVRFAKTKQSGAQLVSFEADAAKHWLRFVGPPANGDIDVDNPRWAEKRHICACDDVALSSRRVCNVFDPPCF